MGKNKFWHKRKKLISQKKIEELESLLVTIGEEVEKIKNKVKVSYKNDDSPLTEADLIVNKALKDFINSTSFKNIISEESQNDSYNLREKWEFFWLIDPIDGTKEFIKGGDDYTINVALCRISRPIFSIVYVPGTKTMFKAIKNVGSYKNGIKIESKRKNYAALRIVASSSHLDKETKNFINEQKKMNSIELVQLGSSLKICSVAEGKADMYPRFSPTMEWDTCAADLILEESNGRMVDKKGQSLRYNKKEFLNPDFICFQKNFTTGDE